MSFYRIARACEDLATSKVIIDDAKRAFEAVTHLINKGYKKIAHFAGPKVLEICRKRLKGYSDALKKGHLDLLEEFIQYGGLDEKDGYSSMNNLLKQNIIPDAIFAVNDLVAIGAYQRIKES